VTLELARLRNLTEEDLGHQVLENFEKFLPA
jgi:hypothetical protein